MSFMMSFIKDIRVLYRYPLKNRRNIRLSRPHWYYGYMSLDKFKKPYDPGSVESTIYAEWEKSGYFNPDVCVEKGVTAPDAEPFSIVLPPPNVTGTLHTGHAMTVAIEDAIVRYERMRGKKTLWVPGTDHAAIATQAKVEKLLEKEGVRKSDLSREAFLERVNAYALDSQTTILSQLRAMGASLDWSRQAFTLDDTRTQSVQTAFLRMYEAGLIYRGNRIVNWDPKGHTVISDEEVEHETRTATLYTFRYGADFPIPISTTRPETKVGDTAVAVHPNDARYKKFVGQTFSVPGFCGVPLEIRIIADTAVDPEFGTGALGVTPAHSHIDADLAATHKLPFRQVIDEQARMTVGDERIHGKKVTEARETIVAWLKENNLLEKEEPVEQNVAIAQRSGGVVEPLPKLQWFIDVNKPFSVPNTTQTMTLKEWMRTVVDEKRITILPDRFEKVYFHWIDNLRDWCISRQIWYGHRIPVWYRGDEMFVGTEAPDKDGWVQDEDTLDTWFSSGLWTFSTLGWPEETPDLQTYHPTSLLETGYDILFFWVARMILMSGFMLGDVPFKTVYLHGLVRDEHNRKMSKSLGNVVDPLILTGKFGTDALRMAMIVSVGPGSDSALSEQKVLAYKKFANKLWNIARFVFDNTADAPSQQPELLSAHTVRLEELNALTEEITRDMEAYRLYLASEKLYHYVWHTFADIIVEETKSVLSGDDPAARASAQWMLEEILKTSLKLLHPFMPFITEEIWKSLPHRDRDMLMVASWPKS